ncbi:MAG: cold shock domain-containing protein [Deltaproteobacteria bacterium]|nr:cold shock domain-containing protein [Deltaproteobacteria bacterium]
MKVGIGTIKVFDRQKKQGVIASRDVTKSDKQEDLYFEISGSQASEISLHKGQLVQFVIKEDTILGSHATDITVLSDKA